MKLRRAIFLLLFALLVLVPLTAMAAPGIRDLDAIDESADTAYREGQYTFCSNPIPALTPRQNELCPLVSEARDCEGLAKACGAAKDAEREDAIGKFLRAMGPLLRVVLYLLIAAIVLVIAIPVVRTIARLRRDKKIIPKESKTNEPNRGEILNAGEMGTLPEISDAEAALVLADEHRARGDYGRALALYLAASLSALDRRGAIRVARHRTNGEYVRTCEDHDAKPALREIVREVDRSFFGGAEATEEGASRARERAHAIVKKVAATAAVFALALSAVGCNNLTRGRDPAGDELPREVLRRNGYDVTRLSSSIATMPVPERGEGAPLLIIDAERVTLEEETQAHLMRWVEAGGALVLFGNPPSWPREIRTKVESSSSRDLTVKTPDPNGGLADIDEEEEENLDRSYTGKMFGQPITVSGARVARGEVLARTNHGSVAVVGMLGADRPYAIKLNVGKGLVLGVANDDLFTNIGMRPRRNPAALVTLVRSVSHDLRRPVSSGTGKTGKTTFGEVRVASAEDGIPPPANPFAALVAAGLGKGAWHALIAALLLFMACGIRQAKARPVPTKPRRAFAEHVEATGALYSRTKSHAHALAAYGKFVELRIREQLPRGADAATFLATRSNEPIENVQSLLKRATEAKAADALKGDELMVIEKLRRVMESLRR